MVKHPSLGKVLYIVCIHKFDADYGPGCGGSPHSAFHSPVAGKARFYGPAWHRVYPEYTAD